MSVPEFESRGGTRLVVLLHSYTNKPQDLAHVRDAVREIWPDADILAPDLPLRRWSFADPIAVVTRVLGDIDRHWMARLADSRSGPYQVVTLVGHSLGSLIARKAYIFASGETTEAPFEPGLAKSWPRDWQKPLEWADKVDRIVLLAGMNRGWSVSHHLSIKKAILWSLGSALGNALTTLGHRPLILGIRRGAPFITQLRIQWLRMRQRAQHGSPGAALTVQLLGTIDDMVSPEDNVDLVSGRDFKYLEVRKSGHLNVIQMDDSETGRQRRATFREAISAPAEEIGSRQVVPADSAETVASIQENVEEVIFVVHGIRDLGYWTKKIAARVKALGVKSRRIFETETSSYGYFPMGPFLLPARRREKVEWLMDQYTEAVARYPKARFSFIGHSNGTYLLARALEDYPCCRFHHVVFAGSVVRRSYDWTSLIKRGRVTAVLNYVATGDWVVALFPKVFEVTGIPDLGSAGHDGFLQAERDPAPDPERDSPHNLGSVRQVEYIRGHHSAALVEDNWDAIARFVVHGEVAAPPHNLSARRRNPLLAALSAVTPLVWLALVGGLVALGVVLVGLVEAEWARTLVGVAYIGVLWKVATRF